MRSLTSPDAVGGTLQVCPPTSRRAGFPTRFATPHPGLRAGGPGTSSDLTLSETLRVDGPMSMSVTGRDRRVVSSSRRALVSR